MSTPAAERPTRPVASSDVVPEPDQGVPPTEVTRPATTPGSDAGTELDSAVEVLRLLADRTRLAILNLLTDRELPVGRIAELLERPVPAVSQHLAKLRAGKLVLTRRDGVTVYYRQANEHVGALVRNVLHQAEHLRFEVPPHHR